MCIWITGLILATLTCGAFGQNVCQLNQTFICPNDSFCANSSGNLECLQCDTACLTCSGPGPTGCQLCAEGYYKSTSLGSPCLTCNTGFFGFNCSSLCHCLNKQSCDAKTGFCSNWMCDRGYTGIPYCQDLCPEGTFGIDCGLVCHCPSGDNCSKVNGDCSSNRCQPNWGSSGCQRRLPQFSLPPKVTDVKCNNITLEWLAFDETNDKGTGPIGQYRVYKILNDSLVINDTGWQLIVNLDVVSGKSVYTYNVQSGLVVGQDYNFRVDVIGADSGSLMSQASVGPETDVVTNLCTTTTTPGPYNTTLAIISRKVFDQINMTAVNSSTVSISWTVLAEVSFYQYNITLTGQLLGNGDCDTSSGLQIVCNRLAKIGDSPLLCGNLSSWSKYKMQISAVAVTADVKETFVQNVTTLYTVPEGSVTNVTYDWLTSSEANLAWSEVPCQQRKGPLSSYNILIMEYNHNRTQQYTYVTQDRYLWLTRLTPYTSYGAQIRYVNPAGEGPLSPVLNFFTLEAVPGPVEITQIFPAVTSAVLTFQPPSEPNGVLTTYTATFSLEPNFSQSQAATIPATSAVASGGLNISVSRLNPDTLYYFKMSASTSTGRGQDGSTKQVRTLVMPAPGNVVRINLMDKTNSCLTIGWTAPNDFLANITSYLVEVRKVSADLTSAGSKVTTSATARNYSLCQLRPSMLYVVNISAMASTGVIASVSDNFVTAHGTPPTPSDPEFVRSNWTNITIAIEPVISPDVPITSYQIRINLVTPDNRKKRSSEIPGSVSAELFPTDVLQQREFIVGDANTYGGYENKILLQNSYYMIYYVAVSILGNDTTASWSQLKAAIRTVPFDPALAPPVSISLENRNMTCLNWSWRLPPGIENMLIGILLAVNITSDGTSVMSLDLPVTTRNYQICRLTPYTVYTVGVMVKLSDGRVIAASEAFITEQNTPRPPPNPVFVNSSYTTITIAIQPAILADAPVTAYQLQVEAVNLSGRRKRFAGVPGSVTAQLFKENVTQKINFIVGDGKTYGGYLNQPLQQETLYTVHYVVISNVSNITKYSYSSLSPAVRTIPYVATLKSTSDDDTIGVFIGVIVGLSLFILLIILIILLYWWWRRRNRFIPYQTQEEDKSGFAFPDVRNEYDPEKYWSISNNLKTSRHIIAGRDLVHGDKHYSKVNRTPPISAASKVSFQDEFHNLPRESKKASDSLARFNSELNRFPHLLPYDHSLVRLRPDTESQNTFINASFLPGYKKTPAYIAAQSPYDENTLLDFWRLIYQKSIRTVVMITNIIEDSIVKCTQYWPDDTKVSYGNFLLHLTDVKQYADYIIRTVVVKIKEEESFKTVKLFEFTSWPEHGVPDDPIPLLELRRQVRIHHQEDASPILVHCGTGMGRTGVFLAVDALIEQYTAEGQVMVFDFVKRMRKDRPYMVRTLKEYVFIYESLFEHFHAGNTLVGLDLKNVYHNWTQRNSRTGFTYLRDQFQLLESYTLGPSREELKTALLEVNVKKNRYPDVLPPDKYRPVLTSLGPLGSTDYINAVFLDGHFVKNQYIITQTPLPSTISDFWRLVYDYDVRTIVMVENLKDDDTSGSDYWANQAQAEPFTIETSVAFQQDNITIRSLRLHHNKYPKIPHRLIKQFQFNAWIQPNSTPQSKTMLMDLIDSVSTWQDEACENSKPVLVHCKDGATHSGLFIAVSILCEKMKAHKEVDVYRSIKHCKRRRSQFVADYDQLRFCYKALWDYLNLRMPGGSLTQVLGQNKLDPLQGVASWSLSSYNSGAANTTVI